MSEARYGNTRVAKIRAVYNELRSALAGDDLEAAQAAFDRYEQWSDYILDKRHFDLLDAVKVERDNYKALYEAERDDELLNIARQAGYQDGAEERRKLEARVKALTAALTYISDPISAIQLKAKADGYQVDGLTALQISRDPGHLQYTARAALQENTDDR